MRTSLPHICRIAAGAGSTAATPTDGVVRMLAQKAKLAMQRMGHAGGSVTMGDWPHLSQWYDGTVIDADAAV